MKKLFILFFLGSLSLVACKDTASGPSSSSDVDTSMEDTLMRTALDRKDFPTALICINTILYKDTTRVELYDTLFNIYNATQNPYAVADVGQKILKLRPNDLDILEPTAAAFEILGSLVPAFELEQRMFSINGDPELKLLMANNLFNQNHVQGAMAELQWIIDNRAKTDTVTTKQPRYENPEQSQEVKIRAVAHYMMGQIFYQNGDKKSALAQMNKANEIDPYYDAAAAAVIELKTGKRP